MKLTWTGPAAADLDDIILHIAQDSVTAALEVEDRIHRALARLPAMPRSGRIGKLAGTYELVVRRTSCIAVYQIEEKEIAILRIIHGAQQWPPSAQ